jgi:hypothetical protein
MKAWLLDVWDSFKALFHENNSASMIRFVTWLWMTTMCAAIIGAEIFYIIKNREMVIPDVPASYITMTSIVVAAKVSQKIWGEPAPPTQPPK